MPGPLEHQCLRTAVGRGTAGRQREEARLEAKLGKSSKPGCQGMGGGKSDCHFGKGAFHGVGAGREKPDCSGGSQTGSAGPLLSGTSAKKKKGLGLERKNLQKRFSFFPATLPSQPPAPPRGDPDHVTWERGQWSSLREGPRRDKE